MDKVTLKNLKNKIKILIKKIKYKVWFIFGIKNSDQKRNERDMKIAHELLKSLNLKSICIDIGSHNGEWLYYFSKYFPNQKHIAFEPLENFYKKLKIQFPNLEIYDYALSNKNGFSKFQYCTNLPAWSGLKKQEMYYDDPKIKTIEVRTAKLDDFKFKNENNIKFMKIDIEGGELDCLEGSITFIKRTRVIIYFEHAYIHFANYGNYSLKIYKYFKNIKYEIISLQSLLPLDLEEFIFIINQAKNKDYKYPSETNFLAIPEEKLINYKNIIKLKSSEV